MAAIHRQYEATLARVATRHLAPEAVPAALDGYAQHLDNTMTRAEAATLSPHLRDTSRLDAHASRFFASHAAQNPDQARATAPAPPARSALKTIRSSAADAELRRRGAY